VGKTDPFEAFCTGSRVYPTSRPVAAGISSSHFCKHKQQLLVFLSYHTVVQHSIGQRSAFGVLAVQILADYLDVGLLPHLLGRFDPKADVASVNMHKQAKRPKKISGLIQTGFCSRQPAHLKLFWAVFMCLRAL